MRSLVRPVADGEINKHVSMAIEPEDDCSLDLLSDHMVKNNPNEDDAVDL